MIEAVGEEYWPTYFATIDRLLAPGGTVVVQAILMSHDRILATRRSYSWIQKYIFPGGLIPSLQAIDDDDRRRTPRCGSTERRQLRAALRRDPARAGGRPSSSAGRRIAELGFDETFRRMWEFYLAYCEAGFATGYLDVAQIRLQRVVA